MSETPLLRVENLKYKYQNTGVKGSDREVLHGLSFTVERGEYVAVIGHNGSGKSTLAKLCMMILDPTEGHIFVDGVDIADPELTDAQVLAVRKKVGMVFQNPDNQMVATMADEEVAFGPENLGIPSEEIRKRVDDALKSVGMSEYAKKEPSRLSGGQKQRIAIAGILAMHPDCIFFDESTSMLDPQGRKDVMEIIDRLNREDGVTIIHITHDMTEAARAKRVMVLHEGNFVMDGTPEEVFAQPEKLDACRLTVPQCTQVMYRLKALGFEIGDRVTTPEDCAEAIRSLLGSGEVRHG